MGFWDWWCELGRRKEACGISLPPGRITELRIFNSVTLSPAHLKHAQEIGMTAPVYAHMLQNAPQNLQMAIQQQLGAQQSGQGLAGGGGGSYMGYYGPTPMSVPTFMPAAQAPPLKLEDGGIRVGEIKAWRWWKYNPSDLLQSVSMNTLWPTTEPMICDKGPPNGWDGRGIYCFKTEGNAINENVGGNVFGRIAIWGTIIECRNGYLAQYAKVISIDHIFGVPVGAASRLRRHYGLPEDGTPLYG